MMADAPNSQPGTLWQAVKRIFQPPVQPPPDLPAPNPKAFAIKEVIAREAQHVRALSADRDVRDRLNPIPPPGEKKPIQDAAPEHFGVAFSGGGIRSASVNLGLIQSLARSGFLRQAHYISGVSGGGYILGWLTGWTARVGFDKVEAQLSADSASPGLDLPARAGFRRYLEPNPIHFLRRYVSFLVPRAGLSSGDTLAAAAMYLRNLLLNQVLLAAALLGIFALLQMAAPALIWPRLINGYGAPLISLCSKVLLALLALTTWTALGLLARNRPPHERKRWAAIARGCGFALCVCLWMLLPAYLRLFSTPGQAMWVPACWTAAFFLSQLIVLLVQTTRFHSLEALQGVSPHDAWWATLLTSLGTGALAAGFTDAFWRWLHSGSAIIVSDSYVIFGLPALLLAASLISFLYVGLFGDAFPDAKREWLGRQAGYFLYFAATAAIVMMIALWGPLSMKWLFRAPHPGWGSAVLKWVLPGGWIATTVGGLFAAQSPKTGKGSSGGPLEALASIAPPVFLLGVMLLLSWSTHHLAVYIHKQEYMTFGVTAAAPPPAPTASKSASAAPAPPQETFNIQSKSSANALSGTKPLTPLALLALISLSLAALLGQRLSVNEFSLHLFYRNRLVRAFLGASNINPRTGMSSRQPDPFTGFTLDDDHYLGSLRQGKFNGPYPMWCASLNLTRGEDLAWQERKASSFIFSPLFCGWDYMPTSTTRIKGNAYREVAACTEDGESNGEGYGGKGGAPLIGTAMAASGAAIAPNMGYHTKPAVAALLTIFNVRIGWWAGNPLHPRGYLKYAPGIGYFLAELLGSANEDKQYVYLSDGGHFENLGVYELVRRRVKYIIACDAGADPEYGFSDFANMVEKCRVDFGVQIEMSNYTGIGPDDKTRLSPTHVAVGLIHYLPQSAAEAAYGTAPGVLLYIKSSLTGDEPAQVLGQRSPGSQFPHDTTLNQFFEETRFEAYRSLGEHMGTFVWDRYHKFRADAANHLPAMDDIMAPELRAQYVREFFECFLKSAMKNASLLATDAPAPPAKPAA
jgi:hypothetical protein